MNNVLSDCQSTEARMNHIRKSFTNSSEVMEFEEFKKSHIESDKFQVFDKPAIEAFIKGLDNSLSDEAVEDPEAAIEAATGLIKSMTHQIVQDSKGTLKDYYFCAVPKSDTAGE